MSRSARISWARLLARIYEVLPLLCPACGGEMKVLSFITDPHTVQAILPRRPSSSSIRRPPSTRPTPAPPRPGLRPVPALSSDTQIYAVGGHPVLRTRC
jgi:hypothetical protein